MYCIRNRVGRRTVDIFRLKNKKTCLGLFPARPSLPEYFKIILLILKKKEKETNKQLNIDFIKQSLISKNKRFLSGFSIHINVSLIIHTG